MWPCGSRPLHLCLSRLVDNNRPYTLFVIDDRAATSDLWPQGAALTPGLTSWDSCNDTGIHLMTPGPRRGHWWKVKSRCPTAAVTSGRDWICWLTDQTVNSAKRNGAGEENLDVCYQRLQVGASQRSFKGHFMLKSKIRDNGKREGEQQRDGEHQW